MVFFPFKFHSGISQRQPQQIQIQIPSILESHIRYLHKSEPKANSGLEGRKGN